MRSSCWDKIEMNSVEKKKTDLKCCMFCINENNVETFFSCPNK